MTVSPRAVVAWAVGFVSARILGYFESSQPSTLEFIQLSQDLQTTRVAIEGFSSCESSLRTEIRYSAGVDAQFRALLVVEVVLILSYILVGIGRRNWLTRVPEHTQPATITDSPAQTTVSSPSSSGTPARAGPLRPSDLRR